MINLIDYIFYRVSYAYIEKYKDKQGYIYGAGVIMIMELMHVYSLLLIAAIENSNFNNWFFGASKNSDSLHQLKSIAIIAFVFILNALYLNRDKYDSLKISFINEDKKVRSKKGWLIGLYTFINIIITMYLAIYRAHLH